MSSVKVILGETELVDNDETIVQAGLSPDAVLHVCFTVAKICFIRWFLIVITCFIVSCSLCTLHYTKYISD